MKILVCGAHGFIGAAICAQLQKDGHEVLKGTREVRRSDEVVINYLRDTEVSDWLPRLRGVDAVVNAIGIITERDGQTFDLIHTRAPQALFAACQQAGIQRVVQISAVGAETRLTPYYASKCAADDFLLAQPGLIARVLRPGMVYGVNGASARLFRMLASLPLHALPGGGKQPVQPVHVDELAEVVSRQLSANSSGCPNLVGAETVSYAQMLQAYRRGMALPRTIGVSLPRFWMSLVATVLDKVPGSIFTKQTWRMLQAAQAYPLDDIIAALGRKPLGISQFIRPAEAGLLRQEALAGWRNPLLRLALAATWLGTAWVSALVYPQADSLALLAQVHLNGTAGLVALYGACGLDALLGLLTLFWPRRALWYGQAALVLAYSVVICMALPQFLAQPFGPVLKNIPILAILLLLASEERAA